MSTGAVVIVTRVESASPIPVVTRVGRNGTVPDSTAAPASAADAPEAAPARRLPRRVEIPPERRLSAPLLATLAAAAGVAAIALGGWAFMSGVGDAGSAQPVEEEAAPPGHIEAIALLARPDTERLPLQGSVGRIILAVQRSNGAALVLNGLGPAPSGWAYQAWVTQADSIRPSSAALFSGEEMLVPLTELVPPGALVSVTLEPATGSFAPTRRAKLFVERPA
jgi:hypothetical protein